jgi:CO/xanthine dehydrogenase Mo-binding subunit
MTAAVKRTEFLAAAGGLVVAFAMPQRAFAQSAPPEAAVDSWLRIAADGTVTVKFGKVEIGTGIATAVAQIVADELDVPFTAVVVTDADTADTPDQGVTAGSASLQVGAVPIRRAAAEARAAIVALAAARLSVPAERLETRDGIVSVRGDGAQRVAYGTLVGGRALQRTLGAQSAPVKDPDTYRVVGTAVARVDLPAKITGTFRYIGDVRVPGMLHGRVVRPPAIGATIAAVDERSLAGIPGIVGVVRRGDFLGVVAETEWSAIQAASRLAVTWSGGGLPAVPDLAAAVRSTPAAATRTLIDRGDTGALGEGAYAASYLWPYQSHGSIGPSCGVADVQADRATIWSASQGIYPLRGALAELLRLPADAVRVRYVEGSGCYGHNGADDAAADAAVLSQALHRPVRVQWMRRDEHGWDPKGPAMVMTMTAALDPARERVAAWRSDVYSPSHSTRPSGKAGNLLAGRLVGVTPAPLQFVGGDRNAKIDYAVAAYRVTMHDLRGGIVTSSAMRGLGGTQNTFANESFMDELAHAAGADAVAFRRRHLTDPRSVAVLDAAAKLAGWEPRPSAARTGSGVARGRGVAFVRYENTDAYVATVAQVLVDIGTGAVRVERVAVAHDCGCIINPDGLRNQIEGNVVQALSRALKEEVTLDAHGVTSIDWRRYPIVRFSEVPQIAIELLDRRREKVLGAGEATTTTIAPAIANAIFDATGARVRTAPFTPARVLAALA